MSNERDDRAWQCVRIVSLHARTDEPRSITLEPGLNIISGAGPHEVSALRSVFVALTTPRRPLLRGIVELNGVPIELDEHFATRLGVGAAPAPVVDLFDRSGPSNSIDASVGEPRGQNEDRLLQLESAAAKLRSERELVRRELQREREDRSHGDVAAPQPDVGHVDRGEAVRSTGLGSRGRLWGRNEPFSDPSASLHPADVAVMCARLRDLIASAPDPGLASLAERLEAAAAQRVYAIHREEALSQLVAECDEAIASAEAYLSEIHDPVLGGESSTDAQTAGTLRARTIARIDLLSELLEYWKAREDGLEDSAGASARVLDEANSVIRANGRAPVSSAARAAAVVRELSGGTVPTEELQAIAELTESLRRFVGADAAHLQGEELAKVAESRLDAGANPNPPVSQRHEAASARVEQLSATESRLSEELAVIEAALNAIERGRDALERGRDELAHGETDSSPSVDTAAQQAPNPFSVDLRGSRGASISWDLAAHIGGLARAPGGVALPVLVIDDGAAPVDIGRRDSELASVERMLISAPGDQLVWITADPSALLSMGGSGLAVNHIRL